MPLTGTKPDIAFSGVCTGKGFQHYSVKICVSSMHKLSAPMTPLHQSLLIDCRPYLVTLLEMVTELALHVTVSAQRFNNIPA